MPCLSTPGSEPPRRLGDTPRRVSLHRSHAQILYPSFLTQRIRDLLYAFFLQGDGNFHQQLKTNAPQKEEGPSLLGESGFWAPEKHFETYIKTRGAEVDAMEKEVSPCPSHLQILNITLTIWLAMRWNPNLRPAPSSPKIVQEELQHGSINARPSGSGCTPVYYRNLWGVLPAYSVPTRRSDRFP